MYLSDRARLAPDKPMVIGGGTGRVTTCATLERRSNQVAHVLRDAGLRGDDAVGVFLENHPRLFEVQGAALRAGLRALQLDPALGEDEVVRVCGEARVMAMIVSGPLLVRVPRLRERLPECRTFLIVGGVSQGWESYEGALGAAPGVPLADEAAGELTYVWQDSAAASQPSIRAVRSVRPSDARELAIAVLRDCGFDDQGVVLATAPLWRPEAGSLALAAHMLGGTVVMMDTFDARESLRLIERYRVTHGQWLSSAFPDLLDLPQPIRQSYDVLSMRCALQTGPRPQPATVQAMLDWWGPILREQRVSAMDIDTTVAGQDVQWIT